MITVLVKRLRHQARIPQQMHDGDVCLDAFSAVKMQVWPGEVAKVPLGIAIELEPGWECVVRPRSGMSLRGAIVIPGTVDSGYRGEVCALLHNASQERIRIAEGERVAQLAVRKVHRVRLVEVERLAESQRGEKGFGSTGA